MPPSSISVDGHLLLTIGRNQSGVAHSAGLKQKIRQLFVICLRFFRYLIGTTSTTAVISRHILTALPSIAELLDSKRNIRVQPSHTNTNRYGDRMLHLPPPTLIGHRLLHINTIGHFDFDLHRPVMERLKPKFVN